VKLKVSERNSSGCRTHSPAVHPELYSLLNRAKAVHSICGGEKIKADTQHKHGFDYKKSVVIAHMSNLDQVRTLVPNRPQEYKKSTQSRRLLTYGIGSLGWPLLL
jgi:hypothetical protein